MRSGAGSTNRDRDRGFLTQYAPARLSGPFAAIVDLLAAVPSIIFGLWGIFVLAPRLEPVAAFLNRNLGWLLLFKAELLDAGSCSGIQLRCLSGGSSLGSQRQQHPAGTVAAIAETEAQYQDTWVNNSAAMYRYEAASAQALALPQFSSPPSIANPTGLAAQASAVPSAAAASPAATTLSSLLSSVPDDLVNNGRFQLANTYANQSISSGFPINLLSYVAQNTSAQALQSVAPEIGQGLSEGESALGESRRLVCPARSEPWARQKHRQQR